MTMPIGEFARRCRLPVSTLRYYDRIGLLLPSDVDPRSGYRRYTPDQLPAAVLISRLRAIGSAPDEIARVLAGGAEARAALISERRRIVTERNARIAALDVVDALLMDTNALAASRRLRVSRPRSVTLDCKLVASLPFRASPTELASTILRQIARLRSRLRAAGVERTGAWGALLPIDIEDAVSGIVFAPLAEGLQPSSIRMTALPIGPAIEVDHHGSQSHLFMPYDTALAAVAQRGREPLGTVLERYPGLDSPASGPPVVITVPFA